MIILDMDGTLLNSNRIVLESSKIVLRKLKEQGKIIVVATGRCLEQAAKYLSAEYVDYILSNNGVVWYSVKDKKVIKCNLLNNKHCIEILEHYNNALSAIYVMDLRLHKFENLNEAKEFIESHNIVHLNVHLKNRDDNIEFIQEIKDKYKDLYPLLMQDSFRDYKWVDILAKDNNKGDNIKKIIDYLNINFEDTICFGDGLNDVEMLKNVKTSVAMGNALKEVKEVATHITDTYDNDGIAKFLTEYFGMENEYDYRFN